MLDQDAPPELPGGQGAMILIWMIMFIALGEGQVGIALLAFLFLLTHHCKDDG